MTKTAIYLSDLSKVLIQQYEGLPLIYNLTYDQMGEEYFAFCKFYILLYTDDTAMLAENPRELQCSLNALYEYYKSNDLTVNTTKIKVMVFSKEKIRKLPTVTFGERRLDIGCIYFFSCNISDEIKLKRLFNSRNVKMLFMRAKFLGVFLKHLINNVHVY